ncbi:MAG: SagB/ThcOx family dehydrogenase [Muribaculaceae bacterium]|nr:SagB/ThcOx family dehydrogenase [Muribaculaceae bacterium]
MTLNKLFLVLIAAASLSSAVAQDIDLPAPSLTGGSSVMEAFWQRHSEREFAPDSLALQDLSDLMFAAQGINRPETAHITAPSAMNKQEVDLYAFLPDGVYFYDKAAHRLVKRANGDQRALVAGFQDFVKTAPVCLVLVGNLERFGQFDNFAMTMVSVDVGIVTENINLFCAGRGLACVPRSLMNTKDISQRLGLSDMELPIMNVVLGYPKNKPQ